MPQLPMSDDAIVEAIRSLLEDKGAPDPLRENDRDYWKELALDAESRYRQALALAMTGQRPGGNEGITHGN